MLINLALGLISIDADLLVHNWCIVVQDLNHSITMNCKINVNLCQLFHWLFLLILQADKDLVHEFVQNDGLTCLVKVGAEADQNHQNYILRGKESVHDVCL